jgi:hypothetical protein
LRRDTLKNGPLSILLLLLSLEMQPQHCLIHDAGEEKHLFNFFCFGDSAEFVMEGNGDFCFEEFFLLFRGRDIISIVSKLITNVK